MGGACGEEFRGALVMRGMKGFRVEGRLCKAGFGVDLQANFWKSPQKTVRLGSTLEGQFEFSASTLRALFLRHQDHQ